MVYAVKLGPVDTGEGRINAYVAFAEKGAYEPVLAERDREGLAGLKALVGRATLVCEPQLGRAGKALGVRSAPAPSWVVPRRAMVALGLGLGRLAEGIDTGALAELAAAAAVFWRARPWRHFGDDEPLALVTAGPPPVTFEASILGAGGLEHGLVLYRRPGAVARVKRHLDRGAISPGGKEDALVVILDTEPRFAARAVKEAFGVPRVPVPVASTRGTAAPASADELLVLAAALRAAAALDPRTGKAAGGLTFRGREVRVKIEAKARA